MKQGQVDGNEQRNEEMRKRLNIKSGVFFRNILVNQVMNPSQVYQRHNLIKSQ